MVAQKARKPNRLPEYDYAQPGAYFITICTLNRQCVLSQISVGATCGRPDPVILMDAGKMVDRELNRIGEIYENVAVDSYVIMPNHIHMILYIREDGGRPQVAPTISRVVKQMKGTVTKKLGRAIWQKGFYDHVIRDAQDYLVKRKYIEENPAKWALDEYHMDR